MSGRYLLKGGTIVTPEKVYSSGLRIDAGRVADIAEDLKEHRGEIVMDCSGHFLFPGLINAHDHLPFNLFPQLGNPPYANSYDWGNDIHSRCKSAIDKITRIPLRERLIWGAWKNLFSGVTSVVHHDPFYSPFRLGYPLHVLKQYTFAHSLGFEPDMRRALSSRRKDRPFITHLAEGTDERAATEVARLKKLGGLDDRTVAVHAVGIDEHDVKTLQDAKASVVWCPASNMFLLNRTAPIDLLSGKVPIAIGTDSTLTGSLTLFDELRTARQLYAFTAKELFSMVTETPRRIFRMQRDVGTIAIGAKANLFLVKAAQSGPYMTLLNAQPGDISALFCEGSLRFCDQSLGVLSGREPAGDAEVRLNGKTKRVSSRSFARCYEMLKPFLTHYTYLN